MMNYISKTYDINGFYLFLIFFELDKIGLHLLYYRNAQITGDINNLFYIGRYHIATPAIGRIFSMPNVIYHKHAGG